MLAACLLQMTAWPGFFERATSRAASAVEFVTSCAASGNFDSSHIRHCPNGFGCERTVVTSPSAVPGRAQRLSDTGRSTSRCTRSSESKASVSRVTLTEPSIEFSSGTSPRSTSPRSTALITCGTDRSATGSPAARSGWVSSASSANVPCGPRKPTLRPDGTRAGVSGPRDAGVRGTQRW